jgi:hypothetical protein
MAWDATRAAWMTCEGERFHMFRQTRDEGRARARRFRNRTSRLVANRRQRSITLATIRDISRRLATRLGFDSRRLIVDADVDIDMYRTTRLHRSSS